MRLLEGTGALQSGHFLLSSGLHSPRYVQCAKAVEHPGDAETLAEEIARRLGSAGVECVLSPPLGGLIIGYEVARQLGCRFVFPERAENGEFHLRRGFCVEQGVRAAVVEDVITTGRTTRELVEMLRGIDANVVAVGAIVDRSGVGEIDGLPIGSVLTLSIPTYEPEVCPLCQAGVPIVKPGSRRESEAPT